LAPRATGLVVIFVPFLKFAELLTKPVIEPSAFCVHRVKTGILSLGAAGLATALGGTGLEGRGGADDAGEESFGFVPNNDSVGRPSDTLGASCFCAVGFGIAFCAAGDLLVADLSPDPKSDNVGRPGCGVAGGGVDFGFGAGFGEGLGAPNSENGCALGVGAGAGFGTGSDFEAGFEAGFAPPKKEKDCGLGEGAEAGSGLRFGTGAAGFVPLPKKFIG
jgi:hypothetical protein